MTLSLSHWYPGSGVVLDCIDSWSLPSFFLRSAYLIFLKYPMKMKYFGLTETKLFHFHRMLKKGAGGGGGFERMQMRRLFCAFVCRKSPKTGD